MIENKLFTAALAISASVVLLLSIAGFVQDTDSNRYRVSVVVDNSSSERWVPFREGLQQAAKDNNIELSFVTTDTLVSVQQEGRIINREIQNGADGIIAAFRSSTGTSEMLSGFVGQADVVLVDTKIDTGGKEDSVGSVTVNNVAVGEALWEQIYKDHPDLGSKGLRIGVLSGNQQQYSLQERLSSFQEEIQGENVDNPWILSYSEELKTELAQEIWKSPVDILVALDNDSMETGVEYIRESGKNIEIYGVGNSDELVYNLDNGRIRFLIVPEEFSMGYHALSDLSALLNHRSIIPVQREISFRRVTRENMYSEENQKILFPRIE